MLFFAEFTIASDLNAAINMWEKLTCLRFVARTASNQKQYTDYVKILQTYDGYDIAYFQALKKIFALIY
jgi:hypothetical protein